MNQVYLPPKFELEKEKIPLNDLYAQHCGLEREIESALSQCLANSNLIMGPAHKALAQDIARDCGGGYVALCGSGTDALTLAIIASLGRGDGSKEIVTVSHTFFATVEAILNAGYIPHFIDIDPSSYCMAPEHLPDAINEKTRAIVPVHLYGQMARMDEISQIASNFNLPVIEDAAQSYGAQWKHKKPGIYGSSACFSFQPSKTPGALGDGGAVYTRDPEIADRVQMLADHGRKEKFVHQLIGFNSRLDEFQAAVIQIKLRHLERWAEARNKIAEIYRHNFASVSLIQTPELATDAYHVYHRYVIQTPERDRVVRLIHECGVNVGVHYPVPLHRQPALQSVMFKSADLSNTEKLADRILSLPIYAELSAAQINRVVESTIESVNRI